MLLRSQVTEVPTTAFTMFTESLDYPRSGTDAVKTIVIGGLLTLLGVLVVPLLFVGGYTVRVAGAVVDGEDCAPRFEHWSDLFVDGLKATFVGIVYFALPTLVLAATGIFALVVSDGSPASAFLTGTVALAGLALAGLLGLVCWYVGAAGFVNFARTGRLGAAFAVGDLRPVLTSGTYATSWLFAVVVLVAASVLGGALEVLPFGLGVVASAVLLFYATVSMTYLHARGVADATAATGIEGRTESSAAHPAN